MDAHLSLSADALLGVVRAEFEQVPDQRAENASLVLADALMSGYALGRRGWEWSARQTTP
jgi:hypothetical protein